MEYTIKNLGSVDQGKIKIKENSLNVKYGINGTGKSTISKGIVKYINKSDLSDMIKYGSNIKPEIVTDKEFEDVLVFNQEYIEEHLFKEDLLNNSFEIMINTKEYRLLYQRINNEFSNLISSLKDTVFDDIRKELDEFKKSLIIKEKLVNGKKVIEIEGKSKLAKGKKINDISELTTKNIEGYTEYLKSGKNYIWLKWFEEGYDLIIDNKCPFCLNDLKPNMKLIHDDISNAFKTTTLKQNAESKKVLNNIKKFIDKNSKEKIEDICRSNEKFSTDDVEFLKKISEICNTEFEKLNRLKNLNVIDIKEIFENDELTNFLKANKLSKNFYTSMDVDVQSKVDNINMIIDNLLLKDKEIKNITNEFSLKINSLINNKCSYVNDFFALAGIPYKIEVITKGDNDFKTILKPINANVDIKKEQLSYGEQNSISLMLFSLEAEKKNGLVILDDPVSSFDNNKKFAILYYLFTKEKAVFKNKTVLLFTHDFSIIIDLMKKHNFRNLNKYFTHISNKNGILTEKDIKPNKVVFTLKHWKGKAMNGNNYLLRIINTRKYIEYAVRDSDALDVLSSILHFYDEPKWSNKDKQENINEKMENAEKIIKEFIPNFSYDFMLNEIKNEEKLKDWYFKSDSSIDRLQILRAYLELKKGSRKDDVFMSFITESYHIENNEFLSLNEKQYDLIPNYIMEMCDKIINDEI